MYAALHKETVLLKIIASNQLLVFYFGYANSFDTEVLCLDLPITDVRSFI